MPRRNALGKHSREPNLCQVHNPALTTFRMNTCEKPGGRGSTATLGIAPLGPTEVVYSRLFAPYRPGRSSHFGRQIPDRCFRAVDVTYEVKTVMGSHTKVPSSASLVVAVLVLALAPPVRPQESH